MDLTVNQRVKSLAESKGLTQYRLAKILSMSPQTINSIFNDKCRPSYEFLSKLAEHFRELNTRWLLTGEGEPFTASVGYELKANEPRPPVQTPVQPVRKRTQKIEKQVATDSQFSLGYKAKKKILHFPCAEYWDKVSYYSGKIVGTN